MSENFDDEKEQFFSEMDWSPTVAQLFGMLPDFVFFMKDLKGRFMMVNRRSCELCQVASEAEMLGKTDFDFWDHSRASLYRESDLQVIKTGIPIVNKIEPAPDLAGSDRLILYSKIPVKNSLGETIGVAGFHRPIEEKGNLPSSFDKLGAALQVMHDDYADQIDFKKLAQLAGMSYNHFSRRFRSQFNIPPREYLTRVRVQAACRMLEETSETITSIALQTGFYDHSHLSRMFSRVMGMSPSTYRSAHFVKGSS